MKMLLKKALVVLIIFAFAFGLRQMFFAKGNIVNEGKIKSKEGGEEVFTGNRKKVFADNVAEDNKALIYFKKEFPNRTVILACEEDLTDDGLKDLLVIYTEQGHNRLVALCKTEDNYSLTPEIPAPVENQTIQFFNMDKEGQMEFIVSGEKSGQVGYAIYRIIDNEIKDLFGEGMNDCC